MDERTATMIVHMYAAALAAQVVAICDRRRLKPNGRRIGELVRALTPERPADDAGFDELLSFVEAKIARMEAASAALK